MKKQIKKILSNLGYKLVKNTDENISVPMSYINVARLFYYYKLFQLTKDVPGDIVECGVGYGRSFLSLANILRVENSEKNIWGFDSFEGFPAPSKEDISNRNPKKGEYAVDLNAINKMLKYHIDDELFFRSKVTLVKGYFENTLENFKAASISLLNLDVDIYLSYKVCLNTLYPKLSIGGIVTFDEYIRESDVFPGAMKAINEFFEVKNVEFVKDSYYGKFYVIKKQDYAT